MLKWGKKIFALWVVVMIAVSSVYVSAEDQTYKTIYLDRHNSFHVAENGLVAVNELNSFAASSEESYGSITAEVNINDTMQCAEVTGKASWAGGDYYNDITILVLRKGLTLENGLDPSEVIYIDQISPDNNGNFHFGFGFRYPPIPGEEYTLYLGGWQLEKPYPINFTYLPASLKEIKVNNQALQGFDFNKTTYEYTISKDTTEIPIVDATATDSQAKVSVQKADSISGTTSILVESRDGSESQMYSIKFNQSELQNDISWDEPSFFDELSRPIDSLTGCNNVIVRLNFYNSGADAELFSIIGAYDSNNKLVSMKIIPVSIQNNQVISINNTIYLPDDTGNYSIKICQWDTMDNMQPFGLPFSFPKQVPSI